ncbi:hypothetical protein Dimus_015887 [Dionaea muscipula]
MAEVIKKFFITSGFMWTVPMAIVYGFLHNWFPGSKDMSPYSKTLLSGFLAVVSVIIIVAIFVFSAMKEPADDHQPDPTFLASAKSSLNQSKPVEGADGSSDVRDKQE